MDHSWHHHRPPPPPGGAPPCPVCSMCHFPFCPPPFPQNYPIHHQYPPPHPDQFYPRPPQLPPPHTPSPPAYDPFLDNAGGPFTNPHRPPWTTNSGFDRDPHGNMYSNSYFSNVGAKRMRFDDWGFSSSPARLHLNENSGNSSEALAEDERRLKLIRDHGGEMSGEPRNFDGRSDMSTLNRLEVSNPFDPGYGDFDGKLKLFSQDSIVEHKQSDRSVEHGQLRHNQVDNGLHQKNVYDYTGNSFDEIEQPRQSYEAMGCNWQGVSGKNAVYDDQRNGFGREYQTLDNEFVHKYAMHHDTEPKRNQYGLHSTYLNNQSGKNMGLPQGSWVFNSQPPLPASPPPPLPMEPLRKHLVKPVVSSSPSGTSASLFPIASGSSTAVPSSYTPVSQSSSLAPAYHPNRGPLHASTGFGSEELQAIQQAPYKAYFRGSEVIPQQPRSPDQPKVIDASHIIKHPHRATRPDHIVIILRGLPGSGKSYLAKMLRDLEVENGGNVPRIHSMDDYFMTEVEKVEESEVPKTSGIVRGKRPVTKKIIEYCFEPEMEEAYRSSMLKAFKKTLDEGVFSFVIVDDRNLRVADFAQFWATAKRSGYEVYLLEATYKDPAGCAARNVHGFTQDDIQKMADLWEEAPTLYLKLDIKSLLHGDGFEESGIQEVDMDMEDGDPVGGLSGSEERNVEKLVVPNVGELVSDGPLKDDERWDAEADHRVEEVKELGKSKWSNDLDEDDIHKKDAKGNLTALSGLNQFFSKEGKSVRWGDQVRNSGFSIAATKTANIASLVIGPGAGYNLKSNPLLDEEKMTASLYRGESKKQSVFQDQLRAEHESFKAVFDKRKQRISGLNGDQD